MNRGVTKLLRQVQRRFGTVWMLAAIVGLLALTWWLQSADEPGNGQAQISSYDQAREMFWWQLYADGGRTLYCDEPFTPEERPVVNIEHVFPMGWVTRSLECSDRNHCRRSSRLFNRIEADLHNLYPSRADVNRARGAFRFGEVPIRHRWSDQCDTRIDRGARTVQPREGARGRIARAMFYMHETYGLEIHRAQGALLKQWHRENPVGEYERWRNDAIEALQGNRNPHIDDPERAEALRF